MEKYRHGEQPYALVTGSSQGLGRAFALELARLGFNVIIHSFSEEELAPARDEITSKHPEIVVKTLVQDAGVAVDWPTLIKQIDNLNITVLINNVGISAVPFTALENIPNEAIEQCIRVNTIFPTQLTRNLLPTLIKGSPSLILNICSGSSYAPSGIITLYNGSKAYNLLWSQSLYHEMRLLKRNVECKAVMTGNVQTYGYNLPTNFVTPTAEVYACSALARAGSRGPIYTGWWRHAVQIMIFRILLAIVPSLMNPVAATITKDVLTYRARIGDKTAMRVEDLPK